VVVRFAKALVIPALVALFIIACGIAAALPLIKDSYRRAAIEVCDLLRDNYYKSDTPDVQKFIQKCRGQAEGQSFLLSKAANIARLNRRLSELHSSHLSVYNPAEYKLLWENTGLDTGMRSRFIEEFIVVYDIVPESPAALKGLRPGDVLETLNGAILSSPSEAQNTAGVYQVARREGKTGETQRMQVEIRPEEVQEDLSPTLEDLGQKVGLLRIPSFLAQYFEEEDWEEISSGLSMFDRLIIDLRDNSGGSFPAMMRAVSPFRCQKPLIGSILRPLREGMKQEADLKDDLQTESQLKQLKESAVLNLRGSDQYGCFNGAVTILIDSGTASTAEIFAQAFYSRPRSRIWGQMSSGQVVLAQWFPLSSLGSDAYSMSVPIGAYHTSDGADLENVGLIPQRQLNYDLDVSLQGRDNWIEAAVSKF
jgi:C-terminal processing protease CtpA/Prc